MVTAGTAQTAVPEAPAAPAAKVPPPPQAIPAKIAIIEFEQVAEATNEGLKANADLQKKYEPNRVQLGTQQKEIDSLTKELQSAPATMTDAEKASRARTIDTKQKQLQRDADDAQTAFGSDMQDAIGKIEQKLGPLVMKYVQQNGYTLLLDRSPLVDNSGQPLQGGLNILWAQGGVDISQAIVNDYNATTPGISAPLPPAPSTTHPAASRPAAPKPAAPKQ
jgi:outer membrane protein